MTATSNATETINSSTLANLTHSKEAMQWQKRLLPFLVGVPIALAFVFIVLATVQLNDFKSAIYSKQQNDLIGAVIPLPKEAKKLNNAEYTKWVTLVHMEQESLDKRYKQAGFLLISRVFTKYLGFFTGMILAIVGAAFIIAKLSEGQTVIDATVTEQAKVNIASSSPGIIFGVLGTTLMLATILTHSDISVQEEPMYLNANTMQVIRSQVSNSKLVDTTMFTDEDKLASKSEEQSKK